MSNDTTVLGVPSTETFEGVTAQAAVAAARAQHGDAVTLSEPVRSLKGGIGGFFSRAHWTVEADLGSRAVAVPAEGTVEDAEDLLSAVEATPSIEVSYVDVLTNATTVPAPVPTTPFAKALAQASRDSTVAAAAGRVESPGATVEAPLADPVASPTLPGGLWPAGQVAPVPAPLAPAGQLWPPTIVPDVTPFPSAVPALPSWLGEALVGVAPALLDDAFAAEVHRVGEAAAITALFAQHYRHPGLPVLDAGEVLIVLGIGPCVVRTAREVAASVGGNAAQVYAAGSSGTIGEVAHARRVRTVADATALVGKSHKAPVVVAVDLGWAGANENLAAVLEALRPVATWAAVDATRRAQDLSRWLDGVPAVDGLVVENAEHTSAVTAPLTLGRPVIFLDGRPASPKRWSSVIVAGAHR